MVMESQRDLRRCFDLVTKDGLLLQFCAEEHKSNAKVVMRAVEQNGLALQYANPKILDKRICYAAIENTKEALQYVPKSILEQISLDYIPVLLEKLKQFDNYSDEEIRLNKEWFKMIYNLEQEIVEIIPHSDVKTAMFLKTNSIPTLEICTTPSDAMLIVKYFQTLNRFVSIQLIDESEPIYLERQSGDESV